MKIKPGIKGPSNVKTTHRAINKNLKNNHLPPDMVQRLILQQTPQDLVEVAKLNQPLENNSIEVLEKLCQDLNKQYYIRLLVFQNINPEAQAQAGEYIHVLNNMITEVQTVIDNKNKILNSSNTNIHDQWAQEQLMNLIAAYELKVGEATTNKIKI